MRVIDNSAKVMREFDKRMNAAVEVVGGLLESAARDLAPRDTGLLANSITHGAAGGRLAKAEYSDDSGGKSGQYGSSEVPTDASGAKYVVVVGTNVHYAPYQELGAPNAHVPASPFLRPAFENNAKEIKKVVEDILSKG